MVHKLTEYLADIKNWVEACNDNEYLKKAIFTYTMNTLNFTTFFMQKDTRENLYSGNIQSIYKVYNIAMNVVESYDAVKNILEEYRDYSNDETRLIVLKTELTDFAKENKATEQEVIEWIIMCEGCTEVIGKIEDVLNSKTTKDIVDMSQTLLNTNLIPSNIRNVDATSTIASYFADGRVDNYKEALNLYHAELIQRSK